MAKSSNPQNAGVTSMARARDPKFAVRAILGTLLAVNVIAAGLLVFPPGGSADDLSKQTQSLQAQLTAGQTTLETTRQHALAVKEGRDEGDKFITDYFLPLRTAYNSLNSELTRNAVAAKIKPKSIAFDGQPIEGSDTLQMLGVTVTCEGTYPDVLKFVHSIDQSPMLLIIESLNAVPEQGSNTLSVSMKIDAFVRGGEGGE